MKVDFLENPGDEVRLEIVPLIDVIFCILTFFILAAVSLTRQQALDLDLPAANTGAPLPSAAQSERLYVSVDAIGQVYLDQQPVSLALLRDVLLQHRETAPNGLIVLYASRDARYEDVVNVLDLLRSVGGNRVALATLPGQDPSQTPTTQDSDSDTFGDGTTPVPSPEDFPTPEEGFPLDPSLEGLQEPNTPFPSDPTRQDEPTAPATPAEPN
ncbi:Putative biopolymer transport protein ExbD [Halomicronema hongdechloris C2206]|uniref:Biopolymer transport protein ExbD n=1 Tax=Halomicronema hongdechloris C2206 TaxID=1641165 RepID=A0A1Z3HKN5_9CYAN|nr:biopolymer transporter ExbD [Halomicronema hongdechloris]ASC70882.1 Putative biopolymer transport protein ExbD [Halomicronema hongdechloris C2206]